MLRQLVHNQASVHPAGGFCCAARHLSRRAQVTHRGWRACFSSTSEIAVAPQTSGRQDAAQEANHRARHASQTAISSFPFACQQLASAATPDTLWPEASRTVLEQVNDQLGGRWLLVGCKDFKQGHPLAGQPARGLLHVTVWADQQEPPNDVDAPTSDPASTDTPQAVNSTTAARLRRQAARARAKQHVEPELTVMKTPLPRRQLAAGSQPFMFSAVYELGTDGWPTGRMYNSSSAFEHETTAGHNKKPEQSCRVFWDGQFRESAMVWLSHRLGDRTEFDIAKPDKRSAGRISTCSTAPPTKPLLVAWACMSWKS